MEEVLDGSTLRLGWDPVVLQGWTVEHYTVYYTTFSTTMGKVFDQHTLHSTENSQTFYLTHLDPKFDHHFQVTVSIVVDSEEYESSKSTPLIFNFGNNVSLLDSRYVVARPK